MSRGGLSPGPRAKSTGAEAPLFRVRKLEKLRELEKLRKLEKLRVLEKLKVPENEQFTLSMIF